jgi:hypothetical protein
VAHLFALRAVEPLEQGGDERLLGGEFGFELRDSRGEQAVLLDECRDLLCGCFDAAANSTGRAGTGVMLRFSS